MTFYVQKSLANGPIRFGVSPRRELEAIDHEPGLSTGGGGEFLRRRTQGHYFADDRRVSAAKLPTTPSISSTPFWSSLKPDGTRRGYAFLALLIFGPIFIILGLAVVANKGPQGWIEVILGIAMIATPIVMTAQRRKQLREQEERERVEREAREARHRAMLSSYTAALKRVRDTGADDDALGELDRERQALELPYDIWAPLGRATVLSVGFQALSRLGTAGSREVARLMDRTSGAAGLSVADENGVKLDLYRVIVWHLLADDRMGETQAEELLAFRKGFDIWDRDVPVEAQAMEEFRRLRGVTKDKLPRKQCTIRLNFHEYCIESTRGSVMKLVTKGRGRSRTQRLEPGEQCGVFITNKRVVLDAKKRIEIPLMQIDDVEVDVDANVLTVRTPKHPVQVQVENPIYTATLIDIATTIDDRPRSFA